MGKKPLVMQKNTEAMRHRAHPHVSRVDAVCATHSSGLRMEIMQLRAAEPEHRTPEAHERSRQRTRSSRCYVNSKPQR